MLKRKTGNVESVSGLTSFRYLRYIFLLRIRRPPPLFFKIFYLILERGAGRERNIDAQEKYLSIASRTP